MKWRVAPTGYVFNTGTFGATLPEGNTPMTKLMVRLQNTIADREERGAAMAEYGLLLALVALAAIVVLAAFGDSITGVFQAADDNLNSNMGGTDTTTTTTTDS